MAITYNKAAFDFGALSFENSDLKSIFNELARTIGSEGRADHSHNHQYHASVETQGGVETNHSLTSGNGCHTTDATTATDATTTTTTTTPAGDTAVDTSATANSGAADVVPGGATTTATTSVGSATDAGTTAPASDTPVITPAAGAETPSHVTDAGTTTASASGSTDAAVTTQQNDATPVSATGTTPDASGASKASTDTTTTVPSDGLTANHSAAADTGQHLSDNAFAFPAQSTSTGASTLDAVSNLISQAGSTGSLQDLGDDIAGFAHELQAYVADHHLTAADAHKLVDAVHATIATSLDLNI